MRRQLSALLWQILAPTLAVAREEGRAETRAAIAALHRDDGDGYCEECLSHGGAFIFYPCRTIRALEA